MTFGKITRITKSKHTGDWRFSVREPGGEVTRYLPAPKTRRFAQPEGPKSEDDSSSAEAEDPHKPTLQIRPPKSAALQAVSDALQKAIASKDRPAVRKAAAVRQAIEKQDELDAKFREAVRRGDKVGAAEAAKARKAFLDKSFLESKREPKLGETWLFSSSFNPPSPVKLVEGATTEGEIAIQYKGGRTRIVKKS